MKTMMPGSACLALFLAASLGSYAIASWAAESTNGIIIPVRVNQGRVIIPARLNGSEPLSFLLDSACTIPTLHPDLADELKLQASGRVRINGIAGEERAPTYRNVVFDLGPAKYAPRRVASIPSERSESRRRRDGVLGSGFFETFVVEIDAAKESIRLFFPANFVYGGSGEIIPFRFRDEIPVVKASIMLSDKRLLDAEFEIDTGCDSGLCIGDHFVKEHGLLNALETRSSEKFGIGGSVDTRSGTVPALRLGQLEIKKPQTDLFLEASPVDPPVAGHIGMGVLRKHKVIFDYSRKRMIIE